MGGYEARLDLARKIRTSRHVLHIRIQNFNIKDYSLVNSKYTKSIRIEPSFSNVLNHYANAMFPISTNNLNPLLLALAHPRKTSYKRNLLQVAVTLHQKFLSLTIIGRIWRTL